MKYQIVKKPEDNYDMFIIRRKYWLFNSYYTDGDGILFMYALVNIIPVLLSLIFIKCHFYITASSICSLSFILSKYLEKHICKTFYTEKDAQECLTKILTKKNKNNKLEVVSTFTLDKHKNTLQIEKL